MSTELSNQNSTLLLEALEESLASTPLTRTELDNYRHSIPLFITDFLHDPFKITKDQRRLFEDITSGKADKILILGGRGTIKTYSAHIITLWKTVCWPNTHVRILGGKFEQALVPYEYCYEDMYRNPRLKGMVLNERHRSFGFRTEPSRSGEQVKPGEPKKTRVRFTNGSRISVATASEKSVRSPHPDVLIVEEARDIPKSLYNSAKYMVFNSNASLIFISTTPPIYPIGLVYDLYKDADKHGFKVYNWKLIEQPYLTDEKRAELHKIELLDPDEYAREVLGQFSSYSGSVFHPVQRILDNVTDNIPQIVPARLRAMGIDWGFVSPTALIIVQQGDMGEIQVIHAEHFIGEEVDKVLRRLVQLAKAFRINLICADSASPGENQRLAQYLRTENTGIRVEEVPFVSEKWEMIQAVDKLLSRSLLKIPRPCPHSEIVLEQMIRYSKDPKAVDRPRVIKQDDHYVDALMLAVKGLTRPRWVDMGLSPQLGGELITG